MMEWNGDLPEGWARISLDEVFDINPPKPHAKALPETTPVSFVPMAAVDERLGAITAAEERPFGSVRKGYTAFQERDVIFAKITPCMENGKAAIASGLRNGLGFGSTEFHVLRSRGAVMPEYLYHVLRQESFRRAAESEMTGSVGQKRVPADYLARVEIPIPPFAEQRRIVATLEETLARVHTTRERLGKVPAILKRFRRSVLAVACSGRLTKEWREESGSSPEWQHLSLEDVCAAFIDYRGRTPPYAGKGIPHLTSSNIRGGKIDWETEKRVTEETYQQYMTRGVPQAGDVLFTTEGPLGAVAVLPDNRRFSLAQRVLVLRGKRDLLIGEYLALALTSPDVQADIEERATGSTVLGIASKNLRHVLVPIPSIPEQRQIVRQVEALFAWADAVERHVEAARERVNRLTQAVPAKAFRGELVPTEAELARREGRDYEPASMLLERIREQKSEGGRRITGRRRSRPKRASAV
jgi:type I restriction enzyme, S subunit